MNPPSPPANPVPPPRWPVLSSYRLVAGLITAVLLVSGAAMSYLAQRQSQLLDGSQTYRSQYGPWSAFELEGEALRLGRAISQYLAHPQPDQLDKLLLRQDILVSRLLLIEQGALSSHAPALSSRKDLLQQVRALTKRIDEALASANQVPPKPPDPAALRQVQQQLDDLSDPLHNMSLDSHLDVTSLSESIRLKLRQAQHLAVGLAVLQGVLLLSMAGIALHKLHQLHQRRNLEQLAEERQAARLVAEQATRAKSAFLANMSHELRTPFHGLLGMLALVERSGLNPQQADHVRTAQGSARHLLNILNDILDHSKLESGHLSISPGTVNLGTLLDEVQRLMRPLAQDKGLALLIERDPLLPTLVQADGTRLKQILFNLLGNAIKFTDRGRVVLRALAQPPDTPGGQALLCLQVQDSGPGMDEDTVARLFMRFQQGDDSISRQHGGTGLGLEISRSLARLMAGDIRVHSSPGKGSCFTLMLPLMKTAEPEPANPATTASQLASATRIDEATLAGLRVLVSEDHDVNRKYLAALFDNLNVQAVFCDHGQDALAEAARTRFDLVLLDLHTPVMDGLQAARAIRQLPGAAGLVPIIAVTADAFDESRQKALDAGMNDFLPKPVLPADLLAMMHRHTDGQPRAAAEAAAAAAVAMATATATAPAAPPTPAKPYPPPPTRRQAWFDSNSADASALQPWIDTPLLGRLAGSLSLDRYRAISRRLLDDEPGNCQRLCAALQAGDMATVASEAHALKGAAATLAFGALSRLAAEVEQMAKQQTAAGATGSTIATRTAASDLPQQLARQLADTRQAVDRLLGDLVGA